MCQRMPALIDSPCIAACKLDSHKICVGCYRHIEEIVDWNKRSDAEKQQILKLCAERRLAEPAPEAVTTVNSVEWQAARQALAARRQQG